MSENRLARETSPYLLQHADNPVHWWAWGPDALAEAKSSGKPILLSVGYAACHWCHVMAHESFEDEATSAVMNELFVNIKVDREERPDIDAIYMNALHRLGERGGWPMTMFLDAGGRPFWGGTYFPKDKRHGLPAFTDVLKEIARIYSDEPDKVEQNAKGILSALEEDKDAAGGRLRISDKLLADVTSRMPGAVDPVHGGISGAPKFPQWSFFWLMWRGAIRYGQDESKRAVTNSLTHICQGGIYDHLAGGFARYSVDERWLVPHFEKMLYDNALLLDLMTEIWRETQDPLLERRIRETVIWVICEMTAPGGGFAASIDADSEGEEGKFYVWTPAQIEEVLGPERAKVFCQAYDVTPDGNFEGRNILNRLHNLDLGDSDTEQALDDMRRELSNARQERVAPAWDDKVLADWNGLMIAALVPAAQLLDDHIALEAAERAFAFIKTEMTVKGRLVHAYRSGRATAPATASDYANMIWGALRLYQATGKSDYLTSARSWAGILDQYYWDPERGGYIYTADDTEHLIVRLRTAHDDATPNANALMISNLTALRLLTGDLAYLTRANQIPDAFGSELGRKLAAHSGVVAGMFDLIAPQHIVVLGDRGDTATRALLNIIHKTSMPGAITQVVSDPSAIADSSPLAGKTKIDGKPTAYVCVGPQCSLPVTDPSELAAVLKTQRQVSVGSS